MRSARNVLEDIKLPKDDPQQCIQILKEALDSGIEFSEFDALELMGYCDQQVVKFYLDRNPPAEHVINIFFYTGNYPEITAACLDHCHFPKTKQDADLVSVSVYNNSGQTFAEACNRFFTSSRCFHAIKLIFEKVPQLINADEINLFQKELMWVPLCANSSDEINKSASEALLAVCKHPEYRFLHEKNYVRDCVSVISAAYPLYSAAHLKNKDLFNLFYFHPDTHPEARGKAITFACKNKNFDLLVEPARQLAQLNHENTAILFYCGMLNRDNPALIKEVVLLILSNLLQAGMYDGIEAFKTGQEPQTAYANNKLTLFNAEPINDLALLRRVLIGAWDYLIGETSKSGLHRYNGFQDILRNPLISSGLKFIASYAVLNEKTWFFESRIKGHLNTAIGRYLYLVNERALAYAEKKNLKLSVLAVNLISAIHAAKYQEFNKISEEKLLAKISKGAKQKSSVHKK